MNRILASILTLQQHLDALARNPTIYRPTVCPTCSFRKLWCHGCYERKADRQSSGSASLNPIPIPRFICRHCHHTCSRLPECIAPRRWYDWAMQQLVILMCLSGYSLHACSRQCGLHRSTIRRWWTEWHNRHHDYSFHLREYAPDLGRSVDFTDFWQRCLQRMSLSQVMVVLDARGLIVP